MASSNPTTGVGVAAYVQVTGTNITNRANGGLTVASEATPNDTTGLNGQGYGAVASTNHPCAQYALTLSLSGKTIGGTAYPSTCQLTTVLKDVANSTVTSSNGNSPVYLSRMDPLAANNESAWYKPSPFVPPTSSPAYNGSIASVSGSGLITALANGQAIIEVQFPTFDNTLGNQTGGTTNPNPDAYSPLQMIYAQILVNVVA